MNKNEIRRNLGILYQEESDKGLTHPFFILILNAFTEEAKAHGYDVTFIHHSLEGTYEPLEKHCRRLGADGMCMVCGDFTHPKIKELISTGFPCVSVDHIFRGMPSVLSDNETGPETGGIRDIQRTSADCLHSRTQQLPGDQDAHQPVQKYDGLPSSAGAGCISA